MYETDCLNQDLDRVSDKPRVMDEAKTVEGRGSPRRKRQRKAAASVSNAIKRLAGKVSLC